MHGSISHHDTISPRRLEKHCAYCFDFGDMSIYREEFATYTYWFAITQVRSSGYHDIKYWITITRDGTVRSEYHALSDDIAELIREKIIGA